MPRNKSSAGGSTIIGTSQVVSDGIKESELTNREEINAGKEVKIAQENTNVMQADARRQASLATIKKDSDIGMENIKVKMYGTTAGLSSAENFKIQSEVIDTTKQENAANHKETLKKIDLDGQLKMKMLDMQHQKMNKEYHEREQQMIMRSNLLEKGMNIDHAENTLAMQYQGNAAAAIIKKGGRLDAKALDFSNTRNLKMTMNVSALSQSVAQNHIGYEANNLNTSSGTQALPLPGPEAAFDSDDDDENIEDSFLDDHEMNKKIFQSATAEELEMEELEFEQKKLELEMKKLALKKINQKIKAHGGTGSADLKGDHKIEMKKKEFEQKKKEFEMAKLDSLADELYEID